MPLVGFEPTIPAGERPQTYALDRAATVTGNIAEHMNTKYIEDGDFRLPPPSRREMRSSGLLYSE